MSNALVLLAQGCEELEAITVTDLLVRAGINVTTAGLDKQVVTASRGTRIIPDTDIDQLAGNHYDLLVLPGGLPGANHLRDDERVQALLKKQVSNNHYVAAICAAPKALARAGLLDGKQVTCYPGSLGDADLTSTTITGNALEIDGKIITSRGPGTAMDFALALIELLEGREKRNEVNQQLVR
ncbi:MAG: DJ-1/PfpI family protein [Gammaproteobacteria bacterium]|nr:DJ-1/PfpI family protein [Gammaproteobacteria bacterium]